MTLEQLRAIRPRHLREAPGVALDEVRAAWHQATMRRTVIWGGRRDDRWVGTAEDLRLAKVELADARLAAERLRRRTATLVALGRMGKSLEDVMAEQRQVMARFTVQVGDFARAVQRAGDAIERAKARNPRFRAELDRLERIPGRRGR